VSRPGKPRFFKPSAPRRVTGGAAKIGDLELSIGRLSDEGRGIAFVDGKPLFVAGALPGEQIRARIINERRDRFEAELLAVRTAALSRIEPRCPQFGRCGGCQLQMLDYEAQLAHKQQVLQRLLDRFAPRWEVPLRGDPWHYRHRARLAVGDDSGTPIVGFRGASSHRVVAATTCDILDRRLLPLLRQLPAWLSQLRQWRRIDEIIIAIDGDARIAIDWRSREPLPIADRERLHQICAEAGIAAGGDTALRYALPSTGSHFHFTLRDFTQVNPAVNDQLVARAIQWLQLESSSSVVDLFCGLGNFTLPLAKIAGQVTGVEVSEAMVARARREAETQGAENIRFIATDLFEPAAIALQSFDRALLDPPRAGARAICEALKSARDLCRIVYVSCNPQTLARDLAILVTGGFRVDRAALIDMFPQSGHIEAIVALART
jgi:23S rRNA (uracil1939-C5)-methyltransferase